MFGNRKPSASSRSLPARSEKVKPTCGLTTRCGAVTAQQRHLFPQMSGDPDRVAVAGDDEVWKTGREPDLGNAMSLYLKCVSIASCRKPSHQIYTQSGVSLSYDRLSVTILSEVFCISEAHSYFLLFLVEGRQAYHNLELTDFPP